MQTKINSKKEILNNEITVLEILNKTIFSKNKSSYIALPSFQRNFEWKVSDIEDLGDTFIKGFNIPELTSVPYTKEKFSSVRNLFSLDKNVSLTNKTMILIDGQQRVTSIIGLFSGNYYIDLLSLCFSENTIFSEKLYKEFKLKKFPIKDDSFCKYSTAKNTPSRFLNFTDLIDKEKSVEIISTFFKKVKHLCEDFSNIKDESKELYEDLRNNILNVKISYKSLENFTTLECIEYFIKINKGGKKLQPTDILNAISALSGLSLNDFFKDSISENKIMSNYFGLESSGLSKIRKVYNILTLIHQITDLKNSESASKTLDTTKKALFNLSDKKVNWSNLWNENRELILKVLEKLNNMNFFIDGKSTQFEEYIIPMIVVFSNDTNNSLLKNQAFLDKVRKIQRRYIAKGEVFSKLEVEVIVSLTKVAKRLMNNESIQNILNEDGNVFSEKLDVQMSHLNLKNVSYKSQKGKMFITILKEAGFCSKTISGFDIGKDEKLSFHHLYPQSRFEDKSYCDRIGNITITSLFENIDTIKEKNVPEYLTSLNKTVDSSQLMKGFKNHLIPFNKEDIFDASFFDGGYESFIEEREDMIKRVLKEYFEIKSSLF